MLNDERNNNAMHRIDIRRRSSHSCVLAFCSHQTQKISLTTDQKMLWRSEGVAPETLDMIYTLAGDEYRIETS